MGSFWTSIPHFTKGSDLVLSFFASALLILIYHWGQKWVAARKDARDDKVAASTEDRAERTEYRDEIKELRTEMKAMQDRVDSLEQQVTLWRDRYYSEQNRSQQLLIMLVRNGIDPGPLGVATPLFAPGSTPASDLPPPK